MTTNTIPRRRTTPSHRVSEAPEAKPSSPAADTLETVREAAGYDLADERPNYTLLPVNRSTELPSRYLPYPEGTKISYQGYYWEEINWFNHSTLPLWEQFPRILEGIHVSGGMSAADLTFMDFLYIGVIRKVLTLGTPKFMVRYRAYGEDQSELLTFDALDFDDLDVPALPANLTIMDNRDVEKPVPIKLVVTPLTVGSYMNLAQQELHEDEIALMAGMITNFEFEEAHEILKKASGKDLITFRVLDQRFNHGLKPVKCMAKQTTVNLKYDPDQPISTENPEYTVLKKEVSVPLDSPDTLIFPDSEAAEFSGDGISFGV